MKRQQITLKIPSSEKLHVQRTVLHPYRLSWTCWFEALTTALYCSPIRLPAKGLVDTPEYLVTSHALQSRHLEIGSLLSLAEIEGRELNPAWSWVSTYWPPAAVRLLTQYLEPSGFASLGAFLSALWSWGISPGRYASRGVAAQLLAAMDSFALQAGQTADHPRYWEELWRSLPPRRIRLHDHTRLHTALDPEDAMPWNLISAHRETKFERQYRISKNTTPRDLAGS